MNKEAKALEERIKKELSQYNNINDRMDALDKILDEEFKKLGIRDVVFDKEEMKIIYNREH